MKAFISYQIKDDISSIVDLLERNNVEVFDSQTDIRYGSSFQDSIRDGIKDCDFLVLVYSSVNPNIAFEAGIGVSLKKPIFSIISEGENHPDFLMDSPYIYAGPNEMDKVEFNLRIFLDKIKPKRKTSVSKIKKHKLYGGFPNHYDQISQWYQEIIAGSEKDFEFFFKQIFELYNLSVIQKGLDSNVKFYADFCIWSDGLSSLIGNPILVEVKNEINRDNIDNLLETILKLIQNNSAESCLVFYDHLRGLTKRDLPNNPRLLCIKISDFVEQFKDSDFNGSIRRIRNQIVHNQY